jgi:prephenate dehydrogenase
MSKPKITIVGLGLVGGSIGLGLVETGREFRVVGHDIDPSRHGLAKKRGAVHETSINLIRACEGADMVIIATPINAIQETLELIAPNLKPGCIVTDTASLKESVLAWAAETLPDGVFFVGGDPLVRPDFEPYDPAVNSSLEMARPDLFKETFYFLCASPETPASAVERVSAMVSLLQARPFFMDVVEHDGIRAAVEGLPILTGLALMKEVSDSPSWKEARRVADHVFGEATASLTGEAVVQRAQVMLNASHLMPRLDALIRELMQLREWLVKRDGEALENALEQANSARTSWLTERQSPDWGEELSELGVTGTFGSLKSAFGFRSRDRRTEED